MYHKNNHLMYIENTVHRLKLQMHTSVWKYVYIYTYLKHFKTIPCSLPCSCHPHIVGEIALDWFLTNPHGEDHFPIKMVDRPWIMAMWAQWSVQ